MKKLPAVLASTVMALSLVATSVYAEGNISGFNNTNAPSTAQKSNAPRGFSSNIFKNIKEVKANTKDDEIVIIEGRLTKFLGKDKYEFTDKYKDTITVELDSDRDWSYIAKDQLIEIVAEVDKDLTGIELDVKKARPLAPAYDGYGRHHRNYRYNDCPYNNDCPYGTNAQNSGSNDK